MDNLRSLRERAKGVNYSVVGLHVTNTPGWLRGNKSTTREKSQKRDQEKENEAPVHLKRAPRRHSAPTHQLEKGGSKQPGADANVGPKKGRSTRSDGLTLEGKSVPARGTSPSASSGDPTKKRTAVQVSSGADAKPAKRSRPSQTKSDIEQLPEQEPKRRLRSSVSTRATSKVDQEDKPQAPAHMKGRRTTEGSPDSAKERLERSNGSEGGRPAAVVSPVDQTGVVQPKTSADLNKDSDTRRRKAENPAPSSMGKTPEDNTPDGNGHPEEPPTNNFVELQVNMAFIVVFAVARSPIRCAIEWQDNDILS